jgi:hypothetical protein
MNMVGYDVKYDDELIDELRQKTPYEFERYIAKWLGECCDYKNIKLTSRSADSGYDISGISIKTGEKVLFECKRYNKRNKVGVREVRNFADACRRKKASKGIVITTGQFTGNVYSEQRDRSIDIEFWDWKELAKRMLNSKKRQASCKTCGKKLPHLYVEYITNYGVLWEKQYQCTDCMAKRTCYYCKKVYDIRIDENCGNVITDKHHKTKKPLCGDCFTALREKNRRIKEEKQKRERDDKRMWIIIAISLSIFLFLVYILPRILSLFVG